MLRGTAPGGSSHMRFPCGKRSVHDAFAGLVQVVVLNRSSNRRAVICLLQVSLAEVADVALQHAHIVLLPPCATLSSGRHPVTLRRNMAVPLNQRAKSLAGFAHLGHMAVGRGLQLKLPPPLRLQSRLRRVLSDPARA